MATKLKCNFSYSDIVSKSGEDNETVTGHFKMRSQPPSVISMHETPIDSVKNGRSTLSASTTPISSSESPITGNRQKVSPTSKCVIWKQRNEVIKTIFPLSFGIFNME